MRLFQIHQIYKNVSLRILIQELVIMRICVEQTTRDEMEQWQLREEKKQKIVFTYWNGMRMSLRESAEDVLGILTKWLFSSHQNEK